MEFTQPTLAKTGRRKVLQIVDIGTGGFRIATVTCQPSVLGFNHLLVQTYQLLAVGVLGIIAIQYRLIEGKAKVAFLVIVSMQRVVHRHQHGPGKTLFVGIHLFDKFCVEGRPSFGFKDIRDGKIEIEEGILIL